MLIIKKSNNFKKLKKLENKILRLDNEESFLINKFTSSYLRGILIPLIVIGFVYYTQLDTSNPSFSIFINSIYLISFATLIYQTLIKKDIFTYFKKLNNITKKTKITERQLLTLQKQVQEDKNTNSADIEQIFQEIQILNDNKEIENIEPSILKEAITQIKNEQNIKNEKHQNEIAVNELLLENNERSTITIS